MKLYKLLFSSTLILGTMIAVSSYSWFSMWMGMEINLLSIIPLLSKNKNLYSSESSMKYFITQAIASMLLLMSVIMMLILNEFIAPQMNSWFSMIMSSALLTKMGAAPFHFWFPEVLEGLSWVNCLIMLTWQKIAPMAILMNSKFSFNFIITIIMTCLIVSTIMAFNQISLRKLLAFSSINHMAWMISSMLISMSSWLFYFTIYSLMNLAIVSMFQKMNTFYLNQLSSIMNKNKLVKISFMVNFLSLGGLPPFLGFLPKWLIINWMSNSGLFSLSFVMIILTLIMLFIYIRITLTYAVIEFNEPKMSSQSNSTLNSTFMTALSLMGLTMAPLMFNLI